jgi:CRISPR-associated protein Csb3
VELADRRWPRPAAWFEQNQFCIACEGALPELVDDLVNAELTQTDQDDDTSSPVEIGSPFRALRLDWWHDEWAGGKELKVWAGTMESVRIARAMQYALRDEKFRTNELFNLGVIAYDPDSSFKKVEPYYFDSRRCPTAHSRDVGFSPNDLQMTTTAFPAVELLCLIGLQRCRPAKTDQPRVFDYFTWNTPLPLNVLPAAVAGHLPHVNRTGYRFENWYRTGQKKHKAFRSAIPLSNRGNP